MYKVWASEPWQQAMQSIEDSLKKYKKKIKNSNMENINWKLTVVNKYR